jgi:SpoVK/Ycf46/Vps4 family AAA+-type ATPase
MNLDSKISFNENFSSISNFVELKYPNEISSYGVFSPKIENQFNCIYKEFLARERLRHYGLKNKSKILLYGEPGCGKTLSTELIAQNLGLVHIKVKFDSLMSSLFGETASNLRKVFEFAEGYNCVLIFDECDYIAKSRTTSNDVGEAPRIVNTFLELLDNFKNTNSILIACTNLKDSLDKAIFRRFDTVIEMPLPEKVEIKKLINNYLFNIETSKDINWGKIIEQLYGLSSANIIKITNEAGVAAVLSNENYIKQIHIEESINKFKEATQ